MRGVLDLPAELVPVQDLILRSLHRVEQRFDAQLASDLPPVTAMCAHVERYRGKMLRPTLVVLGGLAVSDPAEPVDDRLVTDDHVTLAAVCEMVHMATLVHDDVLDEADVRRRGRTLNALHGNELAVILGDYLIAGAYDLCSALDTTLAARMIGQTSMVMCAGELLQLDRREDWSLDRATYFEILDRKTAALIGTACELGALATLGYRSDPRADALGRFGRTLGVAFQIQDDLLDLTGDESVVGKSVGKDLEKGKLTLPVIIHLEQADLHARARSLDLIERARTDPASAARLAQAMLESGSIGAARDEAERLVDQARTALDALDPSPARTLMSLLADAVVERAF